MRGDAMTALVREALSYARTHMQGVRIVWLDREPEICDGVEAVELCSDPGVSGRIVAAVAQDKKLETLLNKLIDGE